MPLKELSVWEDTTPSDRPAKAGDPCCTSVLLPKNRKGCFWRSDHLGSVDARPTPGYNALQAKRVELPLVRRELHHEAGKEKRRGIFSTFPSRFRCAAPSFGGQIRGAGLAAEAVAEAGGEGSLFDKEPVKPWEGKEQRRSLLCLGGIPVGVCLPLLEIFTTLGIFPPKILFSRHSTHQLPPPQVLTIAWI